MERIRTFERAGKQILCFDVSDVKSNEELYGIAENAKETISKYPPASVYTVTNVSRIAFDSRTKEIAAGWMEYNKLYVLSAAFFGVLGVRKLMLNAVFTLSGRSNVKMFYNMEQALEWIDTL